MKFNKLLSLAALLTLLASCGEPSITTPTTSTTDPTVTTTTTTTTTTDPTIPTPDPTTPTPDPTTPPTTGPTIDGGDFNGYYASITSDLTGGVNGTLRQALTELIKPKAYFSYSGTGSGDLGRELCDIDEDPDNSNNMYFYYINASVPKVVSNANDNWNREHCWPQSLSGGLYGKTGGGCDALHIRPTLTKTNSVRGNSKYGKAGSGSWNTISYLGKTYNYGRTGGGYFEPLDEVKGDAARISMYMYVCYFAERNTPLTANFESTARAIEWANADPVSKIEQSRNAKVHASKQKNRNPFVDHPEWVEKIFG